MPSLAAMALGQRGHGRGIKVGMITTLSGGGAGLGIDVRDGFDLALKMAGASDVEVIVEDDQQKPDIAVQIADKMIQSDQVDVLTGIIWSNLAMAVVPAAVAQGKFYLSPNAGPSPLAGAGCDKNYFNVAWQNDNLHEAAGAYANSAGYKNSFMLAPNYPAGTDAITGYKRFYTGAAAGEVYTQLGQTDYAAEIAQIRASGADSVFFFLPGGMGIAFMKQYAQSDVGLPVRTGLFLRPEHPSGGRRRGAWRSHHLPVEQGSRQSGQQGLRRGVPGGIRSVAVALRKPGLRHREPASSAKAKADVGDQDASLRRALEAADFASTRGDFKFGPNHHPIQDIYVREVVKEGDVYTNKVVGVALEDRGDAYAEECKM